MTIKNAGVQVAGHWYGVPLPEKRERPHPALIRVVEPSSQVTRPQTRASGREEPSEMPCESKQLTLTLPAAGPALQSAFTGV